MGAKVIKLDRECWRYKMKDLCDATGLPRQAIHFYIQQELLPPGRKTGRNMAWYTDEHIERLKVIKRLQHERFLPLKAIKAILDGENDVFSPRQHAFLEGVKDNLPETIVTEEDRTQMLTVDEIAQRSGVERKDIVRSFELGVVGGIQDPDGTIRITAADAWLFDSFGEVRRLGFTNELGFSIDDIAFYQELVNKLLQEELRLVSSRLSELSPEKAAQMIERVIPLVDALLIRLHRQKIRDFFADVL
jgi:DNA-binding transcriptional MerR regulator